MNFVPQHQKLTLHSRTNEKKICKILNEKLHKTNPIPEKAKLSSPLPKHKDTVEVAPNKVDNVHSKSPVDMETFQARQKLMEERNRQRKELLAKVLEDKAKQTAEEAQRLNDIQREFKKLDNELSNDVNILRRQIDVACLEYMETQ